MCLELQFMTPSSGTLIKKTRLITNKIREYKEKCNLRVSVLKWDSDLHVFKLFKYFHYGIFFVLFIQSILIEEYDRDTVS